MAPDLYAPIPTPLLPWTRSTDSVADSAYSSHSQLRWDGPQEPRAGEGWRALGMCTLLAPRRSCAASLLSYASETPHHTCQISEYTLWLQVPQLTLACKSTPGLVFFILCTCGGFCNRKGLPLANGSSRDGAHSSAGPFSPILHRVERNPALSP